METFTIPRDGKRALRFAGTILAESRGKWKRGRDYNRYYNLTLYESSGGKYLVHWEFCTQWSGETGRSRLTECATMDEAIAALEAFDPAQWIEAYKPIIARYGDRAQELAAEYCYRQAALEEVIVARYQAQVAEMLGTLDIVEEMEG